MTIWVFPCMRLNASYGSSNFIFFCVSRHNNVCVSALTLNYSFFLHMRSDATPPREIRTDLVLFTRNDRAFSEHSPCDFLLAGNSLEWSYHGYAPAGMYSLVDQSKSYFVHRLQACILFQHSLRFCKPHNSSSCLKSILSDDYCTCIRSFQNVGIRPVNRKTLWYFFVVYIFFFETEHQSGITC